jgi:hypothetical protein
VGVAVGVAGAARPIPNRQVVRRSRAVGGGPAGRPGRLRAFLSPRRGDGSGLVAAAPAVSVRHLIRRFGPFARPYRLAIAAGVVLVALLPAVQAAEIWMFKLVVDRSSCPPTSARCPGSPPWW